MINSII